MLEVNTKVRTQNRGIRKIGDLLVGDVVWNQDNQPALVLEVGEEVEQTGYRIKYRTWETNGSDHSTIIVSGGQKLVTVAAVGMPVLGSGANRPRRVQWFTACVNGTTTLHAEEIEELQEEVLVAEEGDADSNAGSGELRPGAEFGLVLTGIADSDEDNDDTIMAEMPSASQNAAPAAPLPNLHPHINLEPMHNLPHPIDDNEEDEEDAAPVAVQAVPFVDLQLAPAPQGNQGSEYDPESYATITALTEQSSAAVMAQFSGAALMYIEHNLRPRLETDYATTCDCGLFRQINATLPTLDDARVAARVLATPQHASLLDPATVHHGDLYFPTAYAFYNCDHAMAKRSIYITRCPPGLLPGNGMTYDEMRVDPYWSTLR